MPADNSTPWGQLVLAAVAALFGWMAGNEFDLRGDFRRQIDSLERRVEQNQKEIIELIKERKGGD